MACDKARRGHAPLPIHDAPSDGAGPFLDVREKPLGHDRKNDRNTTSESRQALRASPARALVRESLSRPIQGQSPWAAREGVGDEWRDPNRARPFRSSSRSGASNASTWDDGHGLCGWAASSTCECRNARANGGRTGTQFHARSGQGDRAAGSGGGHARGADGGRSTPP